MVSVVTFTHPFPSISDERRLKIVDDAHRSSLNRASHSFRDCERVDDSHASWSCLHLDTMTASLSPRLSSSSSFANRIWIVDERPHRVVIRLATRNEW